MAIAGLFSVASLLMNKFSLTDKITGVNGKIDVGDQLWSTVDKDTYTADTNGVRGKRTK